MVCEESMRKNFTQKRKKKGFSLVILIFITIFACVFHSIIVQVSTKDSSPLEFVRIREVFFTNIIMRLRALPEAALYNSK